LDTVALAHLLWNVLLVIGLRLEKLLEQVKPEKEKPPYWEKPPTARPLQSKPPFCSSEHWLSVLEGQLKLGA
jgi:hypothetical protein